MSNNTHDDQSPKAEILHNDKEFIHYPGGTKEIIRTVERGTDPITGEPFTIINNYLQSDGPCANPWDRHPPSVQVHIGYTGNLTDAGTLLCNQCLKRNKFRIFLNKWCAFFSLRLKQV